MNNINDIINKQIEKCYDKYGSYTSSHEAMGVLFEEIDELWEEVKKKQIDTEKIGNEIIDCIVVLQKMYQDVVIKECDKKRCQCKMI